MFNRAGLLTTFSQPGLVEVDQNGHVRRLQRAAVAGYARPALVERLTHAIGGEDGVDEEECMVRSARVDPADPASTLDIDATPVAQLPLFLRPQLAPPPWRVRVRSPITVDVAAGHAVDEVLGELRGLPTGLPYKIGLPEQTGAPHLHERRSLRRSWSRSRHDREWSAAGIVIDRGARRDLLGTYRVHVYDLMWGPRQNLWDALKTILGPTGGNR